MTHHNLLEISGDDIAQLNDTDLRTLIGMLCECDFRKENLSTIGIVWGGKQDAADGGLDVTVSYDVLPTINSFVPRAQTGFQVKKPDMPRAAILSEMKPKGILREEIKSLIQNHGAYIIVSSSGSTTGMAIKNRVAAMREAVSIEENFEKFHLDFYDRSRIATWVRSHQSMILWVREKIGRPISGWKPYGNWSNSPKGAAEEYILDEKLRFRDDGNPRNEGISVIDGIQLLRDGLSTAKTSIRLVGLSGVGKTRLVQALFDERIGSNAINPFLAFYTDIADHPSPEPRFFAEQLVASSQRAILVIDNCTPDLHRSLTNICKTSESLASLITIEYDIREDIPEETSVFRLQSASISVIESLILNRFECISQSDARRIAEFSDGNARIAVALSNRVKVGETLSGFRDEELFKRLFWQRNDPNESLLISAEVCSVLYSFDGIDTSENSELKLLSSLSGIAVDRLFRDVKKLRDRDLLQTRGKWRAVLPHAIANKLAAQAFNSIPKDKIVNTILHSGSERLIKSFSRRLNYLHDNSVVVEIISDWLSEKGYLGESILNLNEFGMTLFTNVAPVCPKEALKVIHKAANDPGRGSWFASPKNPKFHRFVDLLRKIAYDSDLFYDSILLMSRFALSEHEVTNNSDSAKGALKSLFYIYLSGTHASVNDRASIIRKFLYSDDEECQKLGISLLEASLEAWHFMSHHDFTFGAHPRDYGYQPKSIEERTLWYTTFIEICTDHVLSGKSTADEAKNIFSSKLRGLWTKAGMYDAIEKSISIIIKEGFWGEGLEAVNVTLKYDSKSFSEDVLHRLEKLQDLLNPNTLEDIARKYILPKKGFFWASLLNENKELTTWEIIKKKMNEIAALLIQDENTLDLLLPEILEVCVYGTRDIFFLGQGIAEECDDIIYFWTKIADSFKKVSIETRQINLLRGFLSSISKIDVNVYNYILDEILEDEILSRWLPAFQSTSQIDQQGLVRLNSCLDSDKVEISSFNSLSFGRMHETISDDDLAYLLGKILNKKDGIFAVYEILVMRFHDHNNLSTYSEKLLETTRQFLVEYKFSEKYQKDLIDIDLSQIAKICLVEKNSEIETKKIYNNIVEGFNDFYLSVDQVHEFLNTLASINPEVFIEIFIGSTKIKNDIKKSIFSTVDENGIFVINIPDEYFEYWCDHDPERRCPLLVSVISTFSKSNETGILEWRPIVYTILDKGYNIEEVLRNLAISIRPSMWSGSLSSILRSRLPLVEKLLKHENQIVRDWAEHQLLSLQKEIDYEREFYDKHFRIIDESFE